MLFTLEKQEKIINALIEVHPYEEVAYDIISLENASVEIGSGMIGRLPAPMDEVSFLKKIKEEFSLKMIRHTALRNKNVETVALCGGAGSFLLKNAISCKSDFYISSDFKYHEFFDAEGKLVIADIGHFESEQFTGEIFYEIIKKNFPIFAIRFSDIKTNPVNYF